MDILKLGGGGAGSNNRLGENYAYYTHAQTKSSDIQWLTTLLKFCIAMYTGKNLNTNLQRCQNLKQRSRCHLQAQHAF